MDDLISRQAAIDAVWSLDVELRPSAIDAILNRLNGLPSAQTETVCIAKVTLSDEQIQEAVEKVKNEAVQVLPSAERKKGKWILVKGSNGKDYHKCSQCLHTQEITGVKNYCAICGADMRGEENGSN